MLKERVQQTLMEYLQRVAVSFPPCKRLRRMRYVQSLSIAFGLL
jgi:hypothetical protein